MSKFNFKEYQKALFENSVSSTGRPAKTEIYNLIRGKLLGIAATNKISQPEAYVFGKIRTIDSVTALEYSQDSITEQPAEPKLYTKGTEFRFLETIYVVEQEFTLAFADQFELKEHIYALEQRGFISVKQLASEFGLSKLGVVVSNQKSTVEVTQEFLQDLESQYGTQLLNEALADTQSERINRAMVRLLEDTSFKGAPFVVANSDYNEARKLAQQIIISAREVQKSTGNVVTYVLVTPKVEALLVQSGLIVDQFLNDIEIVSTRFYHAKDKEYFICGFSRDQDDAGEEDIDTIGDAPYTFGSIVYCPYIEEFIDVLDVESMSQNIMVQSRFGLSVAPYQKETSWVLGADTVYHAGKNLNAYMVDVTFPVTP